MLKVFRDNLKNLSWVLWLVIAVFILLVFVDFGGTVPGGQQATGAAAVTVGRQKITYGEFQQAYEQFEAFYRQSMGEQFTRELARQIGLPVQVINRLIADRILTEEGRRMGLTVTDNEVRDEVVRQFGGTFPGTQDYSRILRASGLTPESFEAGLRRDLLATKTRNILADNIYVSEAEVEDTYRDRVERAKIRFIKLAAADLAGEVSLAPEEFEAYFATNRDEYRIAERRSTTYLMVDRQAVQAGLEIGADEVQAYYDENQDEFTRQEQLRARHILAKVDPLADGPEQAGRDEARARIEAAKRRIEGGEAFADVAREISEDPGSGTQGGMLPPFGRGDMVPPFEAAAFAAEPNTLVGPVETDFGFHLIEVLDKQTAGLAPLTEVETVIRQRLATTRGTAETESKARELADRIGRESLAPETWGELAATDDAVAVKTTAAFERSDYVEGIGSATAFSSRAFDLPLGEVSEPLPVGAGWVILAVESIEEPRLPELDEVRAEVEAAALTAAQRKLALERMEAVATTLDGERTFDEIAAELGLEPTESASFGRLDPVGALGRDERINEAALGLDTGQTGGPIAVDDGVILFEVVERERFDPARFAGEKESERTALRDQRFGELLGSLIETRRQEMGVTFDPQLVANFDLALDETS